MTLPDWYFPFAIGWLFGGLTVGGALIWLRHRKAVVDKATGRVR